MKSSNVLKLVLDNYNVKVIEFNSETTSKFSNFIKKIYVINLKQDVIKRNYVICLMKKLGLSFSLVVVKPITDVLYLSMCPKKHITRPEAGCSLSHLWCLRNFIDKQYHNCIVFEDDIVVHKQFKSRFFKIYNNNPKYDFILLGAHDYSHAFLNCSFSKNDKDSIYKPHKHTKFLYGAHANYYSLKGATAMFKLHSHHLSFYDNYYKELFMYLNDTACVCDPNLVVSDISQSSISHQHELLSLKEKQYYKNCFANFDFTSYHFVYLMFIKNMQHPLADDTYETYMKRQILKYFNQDQNKTDIILKRLSYTFLSIDDVKLLFNDTK